MPFVVEQSQEISRREDFALLANARGYREAVEVGVDQGVFADEFLARFDGSWLLLVDPWEPYGNFDIDRNADLIQTVVRLSKYPGRVRIFRAKSVDTAQRIKTWHNPEFVYIDGDHSEEAVSQDLEAWWNVIPPHGMLAGHDYDEEHPGVIRAVTKFANRRGLVLRLTHDKPLVSWYFYKAEPKMLFQRLYLNGEIINPHWKG